MLSNIWIDLNIGNLMSHLKTGGQKTKLYAFTRKYLYTLSSYILHIRLRIQKNKTWAYALKNCRNRWKSFVRYDHDLAIASRETRIHLNNVAYFFSAFHKDNLSSILLPTISIFCSEWERSIVCVKWIIARQRQVLQKGWMSTRDTRRIRDQWKWKVQRPSSWRFTLHSLKLGSIGLLVYFGFSS